MPALLGHILYERSPSFFLEGTGSIILPLQTLVRDPLPSPQATRALSWDPLIVLSRDSAARDLSRVASHLLLFQRVLDWTLPDLPRPCPAPGVAAFPSCLSQAWWEAERRSYGHHEQEGGPTLDLPGSPGPLFLHLGGYRAL